MCTDYLVVYSLFLSWKVYYSSSFTDTRKLSIKPIYWNFQLQILFKSVFMAGKITSFQLVSHVGASKRFSIFGYVIMSTHLRYLLWRRIEVLVSVVSAHSVLKSVHRGKKLACGVHISNYCTDSIGAKIWLFTDSQIQMFAGGNSESWQPL